MTTSTLPFSQSNGRIPVITDRFRDNFNAFESGEILLYLTQHYDRDHPVGYSEMVQGIYSAHGGVGPMQGQDVDETKRLYGVLEIRLSQDRDYLTGPGRGKPSIADFNVFPWIAGHARTITKTLDEWPNLKRINTRKGVQAGFQIPPKV
ncbi:hypothetical protein H4582DRAFT_2114740 [Lactarius indigo]|nr:hypothetical protein H4582DRAFT_2114740 [Lactarius indigo]